MRRELINKLDSIQWTYGLSISDLDYTINLTNRFVDSRLNELSKFIEKSRQENPESADDIIDDIAYYTHVDIDYIWQFCLWRLQAILEGMIVYRYLELENSNGLMGLKSKLKALKEFGFSVSLQTSNELLLWAKLRNVLSHAPPEQFRPGPLNKEDVYSYFNLVKEFLENLESQYKPDS